MATYFMFGKYTADSVKEISAERSTKATSLVEGYGGKVKAGYALLGEHDIVLILEFPGLEAAMKASVALNKLLGISFVTSPAVTVEEFDKLMVGV
jgi:uncharacterized protein with GYD domain